MEYFSRKHIVFILIPLTVPFIKTYSRTLIRLIGRDTWISLFIAAFLLLFFNVFILKIMQKNKVFDVYKLYEIALGKNLGRFFLFFLFLNISFTTIEACGSLATILHTNLLIETPIIFFLIIIYIIGIYISSKKTYAIFTLSTISTSIIVVAGLGLSYLASPYKNFDTLKPILMNGIDNTFFLSIIKCLGGLSTFFLCFFYLPFIKNKDKVIKPYVLGFIFCIQVVIFASIGQITTFQIDRLKNMWFPALLQTQLISHFEIAESGELFVMIQIVGGWLLRFVLSSHILYLLINKTKLNTKITFYCFNVVLLVITYLLTKTIFSWFDFINLFVYLCFFQYIVIPFIITIILSIKKLPN